MSVVRRLPSTSTIFHTLSRRAPTISYSALNVPLRSRSYSEQTNKSDEEQQQQQKTEEQLKTEQQQQQEEKKEVDPQQRIKELEGELKQSNDDLLRALAERENLVRISKNNVENAKIYGIKSFAEGMLEVADNLGRALSSVPPEKRENPDVKLLFEGVAMTERVMLQVLARFGIKKFDPLGEKFDPSKCSALFEIQDPTKPAGTVAYVQAHGYTLHERLLRAAQVGVVAARPEEPSPESKEQSQVQ